MQNLLLGRTLQFFGASAASIFREINDIPKMNSTSCFESKSCEEIEKRNFCGMN